MKTPEKDFGQQHKDMYIINLDMTRVFWLLAVGLFMITFFFLFGYWLGSDPDQTYPAKSFSITKTHQKNLVSINKNDIVSDTTKKTLSDVDMYANNQSASGDDGATETRRTQESSDQPTESSSEEGLTDQSLSRSKKYTIQVSANRVAGNAHRLKDKLLSKGFHAYIFEKNRNGSLLYFVRVGSFSSELKAKKTLRRVRTIKNARNSRLING